MVGCTLSFEKWEWGLPSCNPCPLFIPHLFPSHSPLMCLWSVPSGEISPPSAVFNAEDMAHASPMHHLLSASWPLRKRPLLLAPFHKGRNWGCSKVNGLVQGNSANKRPWSFTQAPNHSLITEYLLHIQNKKSTHSASLHGNLHGTTESNKKQLLDLVGI